MPLLRFHKTLYLLQFPFPHAPENLSFTGIIEDPSITFTFLVSFFIFCLYRVLCFFVFVFVLFFVFMFVEWFWVRKSLFLSEGAVIICQWGVGDDALGCVWGIPCNTPNYTIVVLLHV